jgi:hypothetical protein
MATCEAAMKVEIELEEGSVVQLPGRKSRSYWRRGGDGAAGRGERTA